MSAPTLPELVNALRGALDALERPVDAADDGPDQFDGETMHERELRVGPR